MLCAADKKPRRRVRVFPRPAGPGDLDVGRSRYRSLAYTGYRQVAVQHFRAGRGYLFNHRHHFGVFEQGVETAVRLFPIQPHLSSIALKPNRFQA